MVVVFGLTCVFLVLVVVILSGCSSLFSRQCEGVCSWVSPYECGFIPNSISFDSFSFSYFSLLVFFVVFDLEISLLLNMPEQMTELFGFYCYVGFLVVLSVGFLVEAVLGYVRWGY
uniref:NADH-ubiquinone oxidoreductase chain 3 n=1 Tax=Atractolytocestus huronensis TaxID=507542 RepID=H9YU13_9CEST|nr:NADH dehydrogenase subunit 3 [Atractolytocestus huronensis]AFH27162.1 NADH dehydrogenase subunit 3 [Atractolytocestus huronensis]ASL24620.1 NADH dehydrogenase subunit 3 [Atractolytocestus huronensis]